MTGSRTQSHSDYVILGSATKGTKVVAFVRRDLVDSVELVVTTARAVVVVVVGCRIGGVYGKCGIGVHAMQDWLGLLAGWNRGGDWVFLGDWNTHHHTWSLDGRSGPGGRVLTEWVQEQGAEIHFVEGGTFETRRRGSIVQSRIDFVITLPNGGWTSQDEDWLLWDHVSIGESLCVGVLERVDGREVIDWDKLAATLADKDKGWYDGLVGDTVYDRLLNL